MGARLRPLTSPSLLPGVAAVAVSACAGVALAAFGPLPTMGALLATAGCALLFATGWELASLLLAVSFFVSTGPAVIGSGVYQPLVWGSFGLVITAGLLRGRLTTTL